ncbi:flagellin [Cryptosporangium sp. NPDC048952]|uniref:flagellin N-terminal helical domain-containing protein n=1 Tax=Cryptosporangium sp. NPDC048952 TaxID=3363961 RepID=UPI003712FC76
MSLRINTNVSAANAYRNLSVNDKSVSGSMEKLSSGLRINRAADDAAGLSVSEGLKSQIGGLTVAARNAQDGVNVAQTADGALSETSSILQRMRDLSVQAANSGSQDSDAKKAANTEFQALNTELDRIVSSTKFGSQSLLDGNYNGAFQVDSASKASNTGAQINVDLSTSKLTAGGNITGLDSQGLGTKSLDLTTDADGAIDALDKAIKGVSSARSEIGAVQNRFEHTINNVNVAIENLSASKSSITDTDMASEMVKFSKNQILQQAGTSMLAQANQSGQGVLKLLG